MHLFNESRCDNRPSFSEVNAWWDLFAVCLSHKYLDRIQPYLSIGWRALSQWCLCNTRHVQCTVETVMNRSRPSHTAVAAIQLHYDGSRRWRLKTYKHTEAMAFINRTRSQAVDRIAPTILTHSTFRGHVTSRSRDHLIPHSPFPIGSFGIKPLSLMVSEIFNVECNATWPW